MAGESGWASGALTGAFMAFAGCVLVHGISGYFGILGVNPLELASNLVTDGMAGVHNVFADASIGADVVSDGGQDFASVFDTPIENDIPDGCHYHLDGELHCGTHDAPAIDWG